MHLLFSNITHYLNYIGNLSNAIFFLIIALYSIM